ncbi:MAG: leucyl/phenylalanyl-tRNA--protein transferase, partial [Saprospiraceae bacterium]
DLICAYRFGIFPVNDPEDPIAWWSPNPRWVLDPKKVKVSKSMRKVIRDQPWKMSVDTCFADVMRMCAQSKKRKSGLDTWITEEIIVEYTKLFEMGRAHSFEVWNGTELVGGFYGVLTGTIFSGESMFAHESNASKYAFIIGCQFFEHLGIELVDC